MRAVVDKTNKPVVLHSPQAHNVTLGANANTYTDEDATTVAVKSGSYNKKQFMKKKDKQQEKKDQLLEQGSKKSSLCYYHASFGDRANNCHAPCTCLEN
jgi:hypothetical protein